MGKSKKQEEFFQFPLCLLNLPPDEPNPYDTPESWLVQHIVSWQLVHGGEKYRQRDVEQHGEEWARRFVDNRAQELESKGALPNSYDAEDWRHRAIVKATTVHEVALGSFRSIVERYDRARRHLDTFQKAVGDGKGYARVRVRRDLIWHHLNPGKMSLREFRVVAAVYSKIGGKKPYTTCHFESEMKWRASGYKSEAAYEAAGGPQRFVSEKGKVEGQPVQLDRDALPAPPEDSESGYSGSNKPAGFFRYDEAVTYHRRGNFDGPLVGEGGMFDALATSTGAFFRLLPRHFPEDGSNPTTGRFDLRNVYRHGERVVFDWQGLQVGTVEKVGGQNLDVRTADGRAHTTLHRSCRAAPVRFFEEAVKQAEAQAEAAAEAEEERAAWPGLLTVDQIRYTVGKMLDTKWLFKYHDGRRNWFSHRNNSEEIADLRSKSKRERLKREQTETKARIEAKKKTLREQRALDDLKAQEEALDAELNGDGSEGNAASGSGKQSRPPRRGAGDGAPGGQDLPPNVTGALGTLFQDEEPRGNRR